MGNLEDLAKNRDALLLAEVAAWLHMFGKFHEDFLNGDHGMDKKVPDDVKNHYQDLYKLLDDSGWTGNLWGKLPELRARGVSIHDLVRRHRPLTSGHEGLVKLLQDAHGRGSGIEKGVFLGSAPPHANENPTYLSNAFGYETTIINTDIQLKRKQLYKFLQDQLMSLVKQLSNLKKGTQLSDEYWLDFRKGFVSTIEQYYLISVAETRRPANDVSLFDQTALSVACFKTMLAQYIIEGWMDPEQQLISNKYHWRFLHIGIDEQLFWGNSSRIGDLLSRKMLVQKSFDEVNNLLTVTYPIGFEIYRDRLGCTFIVPGVAESTLKNHLRDIVHLRRIIQDITNVQDVTKVKEQFFGEADFKLYLSEKTRNMLVLGQVSSMPLPAPTPNIEQVRKWWQGKVGDICTVCGLRPQGPSTKAKSRHVCNVCETRRYESSQQWIQELYKTIWVDEVSDNQGRIALIVAQFDLEDWLSGYAFNTVLSFNFVEQNINLFDLTHEIKQGLEKNLDFNSTPILAKFLEQRIRNDLRTVQMAYETYVVDTDLKHRLPGYKPESLALSLIRKWPAPARVYRAWRNTQSFWKSIVTDFKTMITEVNARLQIQGKFFPGKGPREILGITHTYDIKVQNITLSLVCVAEGEFLTVDNLQRTAILLNAPLDKRRDYLSSATYIQSLLPQGELMDIEEPYGYESSDQYSTSRLLGQLRINSVIIKSVTYIPAIPILTEPRTFMALIPADKALDVTKAIKGKYKDEMGKVQNRLPLTLGIVFAGRRTPLPAILDAGRRMLRQPTRVESWVIEEIDKNSSQKEVNLTLRKEENSLPVGVPIVMGDGITKDPWYPYWCVKKDKNGPIKPFSRGRQFTGVDDTEWVHACNLQVDDEVSFMPSRFDFEFLDTASRRFEISYDENGKRRGDTRIARPYYLEQLDEIEELWNILFDKLAISQIHNLVELIEAKRLAWEAAQDKSVFEKMVCNILNNAGWNPRLDEKAFAKVLRAAVNGQLTDVVELHMHILKPE